MLGFLVQGALLGLSAAISPGPFQSLIIAESLLGGWKRAAPVTLAPLVADIPIAFVLVFVLKQVPEGFLDVVQLGGAFLLLYLAWTLWQELRSGNKGASQDAIKPSTGRRGFLMGAAMLFLSPGSYLYWSLVLGPLLLDALGNSLLHAITFLAGFYTFSIGGLLGIVFLLGRARESSQTIRRGLQIASLALVLVIAVVLFASALSL